MSRARFVLWLACWAAPCLACSAPTPTTLASGLDYPLGLAVRGGQVYFSDHGAIMRVSTRGGPVKVLASDQLRPDALATDGTNVYWIHRGETVGSVMKVPIDGGRPTSLATDQNHPTGIVTDGASVYYTNQGRDLAGLIPDGAVMKVPVDGGAAVALASDVTHPGPIAIDDTTVYFTSAAPNSPSWQVLAMPHEGGSTTTLATGQYDPAAIAVDATSVYWVAQQIDQFMDSRSHGVSIMKVPKTGGPPTKLAELSPENYYYPPAVFGVDPTSVYFVDGDFLEVPVGGGAVVPFAIGFGSNVLGFALDDEYVYWTTEGASYRTAPGAGSVLKTPKSP